VAKVIWLKGALRATMQNNEERNLQKSSIVYLHDVLMTGDKSEAQITFTDGSSVTFYPNTKFVVEKYSFAKKKSGSVGSYFVNLIQGGFRSITGLIAKDNPNDYQVNTPVATIGVRGTDFAVAIKSNQVYVARYAGQPCVSNKTNPKTLCLSETAAYAGVASAGSIPIPITERPDVFGEKLEVVPATVSFGSNVIYKTAPNGAITSFCISQ
jgi:hypothetical protein